MIFVVLGAGTPEVLSLLLEHFDPSSFCLQRYYWYLRTACEFDNLIVVRALISWHEAGWRHACKTYKKELLFASFLFESWKSFEFILPFASDEALKDISHYSAFSDDLIVLGLLAKGSFDFAQDNNYLLKSAAAFKSGHVFAKLSEEYGCSLPAENSILERINRFLGREGPALNTILEDDVSSLANYNVFLKEDLTFFEELSAEYQGFVATSNLKCLEYDQHAISPFKIFSRDVLYCAFLLSMLLLRWLWRLCDLLPCPASSLHPR